MCSVVTGLLVGAIFATWKHTEGEELENEKLWPDNPQLIPTYYMIAASIVTIVAHVGLIIVHCRNRERYLTEAYTKRDRVMFFFSFLSSSLLALLLPRRVVFLQNSMGH